MKTAIITGTSSGIGREILKAFLSLDEEWNIYGLCRTASMQDVDDLPSFRYHPIPCDLTRHDDIEHAIRQVRSNIKSSSEGSIDLLVNNAGVGLFGMHEELSPSNIHKMVALNLEAPMILSSLLLRDLKKSGGQIINISSVTATMASPHGCAYGATKSGLSSFSKSLFEENRKYGIKVTVIQPDMTETAFYDNAEFGCDDDIYCHIEPSEVADSVMSIVNMRKGLVPTELTLRPQYHRVSNKHAAK